METLSYFFALLNKADANGYFNTSNPNSTNFIYWVYEELNSIIQKNNRKKKDSLLRIKYGQSLLNRIEKIEIASEIKKYSLEDISQIIEKENTEKYPQSLEINFKNVSEILSNIILPDKFKSEERQLENAISTLLSYFFKPENIKRQYSIGGNFGFKIDIDVGNGKVGVELKIYDNLDTLGLQRLFGQVIYYKNLCYKEKQLIVFIAGSNEPDAKIMEIKTFMEELGVLVIYSRLLNKRK